MLIHLPQLVVGESQVLFQAQHPLGVAETHPKFFRIERRRNELVGARGKTLEHLAALIVGRQDDDVRVTR